MSSQSRDRRARVLKKTKHLVEQLEGRTLLASITEFGLSPSATPTDITTGPDGNLWFTENNTDKIGMMTTSGSITEFALTSGSHPDGITSGPDGNLWFTEPGTNKIGQITTSGSITEFALNSGSEPNGITTGPDGNLWFTESGTDKVANIVPSGVNAGAITEFSLSSGSQPNGITTGPDGNLWFTETGTNSVGNIIPSGVNAGTISEFFLSSGSQPYGITTGSDGNLWFTEAGTDRVANIVPSGENAGTVTEFPIPTPDSFPTGIVAGPLGDLYFSEHGTNRIGQITTSGTVTNEFLTPTTSSAPSGLVLGPDNHVWFTESTASQIGRLNIEPTATDDSYTAVENTALTENAAAGVLANDSDPEDDPLQILTFSEPTHGNLILNNDGSFTYTPDNNFFGTDSFTYTAFDNTDGSDLATVTIQVDAPPVAVNDCYTTLENTALTQDAASGVLANDTDADSDPLTAFLVDEPTHGSLTLNPDGSFTYTPDNNYFGTDCFTYTANDGFTDGNTATVHLTIDAPPVAVNDCYTAIENTPLVENAAAGVLANDTDADGDPLTAVLVTEPINGSLTLNPDGSFTYTPNNNSIGADSFTYMANDGITDGNIATVNLTVDAPPIAFNDCYTTVENTPLAENAAAGVLANDVQVQDNPLTAVLVAEPINGSLTLNPDGSFTYTPDNNYFGTDCFTYTANDGFTNGNTATVRLTIDAPPDTVNDCYTAIENTALTQDAVSGVLANDTDADGDSLTAVLVDPPSHGTLNLNPDGSFTYTPDNNYFGTDCFTYTANDGFTNGNTATVRLTIDAPPVAVNDCYTAIENTALTQDAASGVLANDTDADGDPLTAVLVDPPSHGSLTFNPDGSFTYTSNNGYFGTDCFTYTANDGVTDGNTATVRLTIDAPPVAVNDTYTAIVNTALTQDAASGVLANDSDPDGDPLTAVLVAEPTHGSLTLNDDGSFTYTPNNGYSGADSFTYQANDGTTTGNTATVSLRVDNPPVAVNDSDTVIDTTALTRDAASGVLANDSDPDGDPLTAVLVTGPTHGSLTLNPDGSFTYTSNSGYFGADSFTYEANDGFANSNIATVSLTVHAPPVAVNDSATTAEQVTLTRSAAAGVLANDTDAEGHPLTAVLVTGPTHGSLTLNADGSFTYIPGALFFGSDSFTYTANDAITHSNMATVNITVKMDHAPVAVNDSASVVQGGSLTVAAPGLLANDIDSDNDSLTALLVATPAHGQLVFNNNGSYTYTPNPTFTGSDSFAYLAFDGILTSNVATVSLTVNTAPPPPKGVTGDFDSDGRSDFGVYRPSTSEWIIDQSTAGLLNPVPSFGAPNLSDIPVIGDFDGIGRSELAVFRPSTDQWFVMGPSGGRLLGTFGGPGDIPVPGDYDGVGHAELAVFRPSTAQWFVLQPNGSQLVRTFGGPGDIPVPGDYDGVGHTELAVFRPSTAQWFMLGPGGDQVVRKFGATDLLDIPVPGDYDGVGHTELAVFRPSTAQWFVLQPNGSQLVRTFGATNLFDIPMEATVGSLVLLGLTGTDGMSATVSATSVTGHEMTASAATPVASATDAVNTGPDQDPSSALATTPGRQSITLNAVDQALDEMPSTTRFALSVQIPDPSSIINSFLFPSIKTPRKKHGSH